MTHAAPALTFRTALKELGFFYALFVLVVSGPSVLSLLQTVFVEHRLIDALQWIVDGYNDIAAVIGGIVEPLAAPAIAWLERTLQADLTLQPWWRPLFILIMMFVVGWARAAWHSGQRGGAAAFAVLGVLGALVGALLAGLMPVTIPAGMLPNDLPPAFLSRVVPGIIAGAPLLFAVLFASAPLAYMDGARGRELIVGTLLFAAMSIVMAWLGVLAAVAWTAAGFRAAGVLGLGTAILFIAFLALLGGLNRPVTDMARSSARLALILLGGFLVAALILVADAVLKQLQI